MNDRLWSYSGSPDLVSIRLKPFQPKMEGGFVIFIRLIDDSTWIFASNDPNKCITSWKNTAKKFGLPAAEQAVVSIPVLLYSSVKNKIRERLERYRFNETDAYKADMQIIVQEAEAVLKMAMPAILHEY